MSYRATLDGAAIINIETGACIPVDEANKDYMDFLQWVSDGNTPLPAEVIPESQKARAALEQLEQTTMMNRFVREFMIVAMQDLAKRLSEQLAQGGTVTTPAQILAANKGWQRLWETDQIATELRGKLGL